MDCAKISYCQAFISFCFRILWTDFHHETVEMPIQILEPEFSQSPGTVRGLANDLRSGIPIARVKLVQISTNISPVIPAIGPRLAHSTRNQPNINISAFYAG